MNRALSATLCGLGAAALLASGPSPARAQGTSWSESWVGSDWELYTRARALRGALPSQSWSIRPFAPNLIDRFSAALTADHPWQRRLARRDSAPSLEILRPSVSSSYNDAFAWGSNDGAVWQGRGLNVWASAGVAAHWRRFSARFEPLMHYSANRAFALESVGPGANPFVDGMRPLAIDLPQRFGAAAFRRATPGQSYVRYTDNHVTAAFSTENIFWGAAYRNPIMLGANAAGFPHLTVGTSRDLATRFGRVRGRVMYGQLSHSAWRPPTGVATRFASGMVASWTLPKAPIELGFTRFFHSAWPSRLGLQQLLKPFGLKVDTLHEQDTVNVLPPDNQLATVFVTLHNAQAGLEFYAEFGSNDRYADLRDAGIETEHNSAWSVGGMATWPRGDARTFWTARLEYLNGRIAPVANIGRFQASFYEHASITEGHTEAGQLLGSPLMERSGGFELAVDRWAPFGRAGLVMMERQMPADGGVGVTESAARSQWELGASALIFVGRGDVNVSIGRVWDVDRLPGVEMRNTYFRVGWRSALR